MCVCVCVCVRTRTCTRMRVYVCALLYPFLLHFLFTFVTFLGCIDVDIGPIVYRDLQRAQEHLVLAGNLHLVHLVTPYDLTLSMKVNNWQAL